MVIASAVVFSVLTGILILFQGALAAGLPWGKASMGGRYPGVYPVHMRVLAVVNMIVLAGLAGVVLSRAQILLPQLFEFSKTAIWVIAAFFLLAAIMNTVTPSRIERIWAPVAALQAVTCLMIALS